VLKKIAVAVALLIAVGVAVVALQPSQFRVARSTAVDAPPAVVFAQVNDLHRFQGWSPWAERDPAARIRFEGPPAGTGATFRWEGNREVGKGSLTITESRPHERILMRLDFVEPFEVSNRVEFSFEPRGARTDVTWSMSGENGFAAKAVGLLIDMDAMVGGDFEKGLAALKQQAEAEAGA
jgi:uncharacterized protein YndB with AHSA1/START domain